MNAVMSPADGVRVDDPDLDSPLARLAGARPPAPDWFAAALARRAHAFQVVSDGARLDTRVWQGPGPDAPGLVLVHGNGAHVGWWDFIAPFFTDTWTVAGFSLSGMGQSDWRSRYTMELFADEVIAVARAAGLMDRAQRPVVVAHSFGGAVAMAAAVRAGDTLGAAVIVDTPIHPPGHDEGERGPPSRTGPNRIYPSEAAALARFRLAPRQRCDNAFLLDHIARGSLKQVEAGPDHPAGWQWRFDPFLWQGFDFDDHEGSALGHARCPLAFMWGEQSRLMTPPVLAHIRARMPQAPMVAIPQAAHHVMLDQPLAFVTAVRGLLAGWPR
jgi:pimeloyl-ACP methyl ester carboxylesterase